MNHEILRTPSVGSLVKKITEENPSLGVQDIVRIIRQATSRRAGIETVDERLAMDLARQALDPSPGTAR